MPFDQAQSLTMLPDPLPIPTVSRPFDVSIRPPGSKSITNRALLLAALAEGTSILRGALTEADDAQVMINALRQLGVTIESIIAATDAQPALRIIGVGGRWRLGPDSTTTLDLHNAGTATRFLTAAALLAPPTTSIIIDGDPRMRERPIGELVNALTELVRHTGGSIEYIARPGYPPIRIRGVDPSITSKVPTGPINFGRTQSSQFISALLIAAPLLSNGLTIQFDDAITSEPYIDMTVGLLRQIGLVIEDHRPRAIHIPRQHLRAFELDIEPDASGATYFEAAAALVPGSRISISGLDLGPRGTLQGDTHFVRVVAELGGIVERVGQGPRASIRVTGPSQLRPIDVDLADMPDTAMTAAVLCCFAQPTSDNPTATSSLRGLRTLRVKETDRLEALRIELTKLGARIEIFKDGDDEGLRITPPRDFPASAPRGISFDTYHDHRMAMALALVGLRVPGVLINNPGCVAKTYPGYWNDLARLYAPEARH